MSTINIPTAINAVGLAEIESFLQANFRKAVEHGPGYFTASMLNAWAADAEARLGEGNPPRIEIRSHDSIDGTTCEFTVSNAGVDYSEIAVDE